MTSIRDNIYWNKRGRYQFYADALQHRVPNEGSVTNPYKNKALERFRKASNAYYDLYNNGLWNRAASFAKLFNVRPSDYLPSREIGYTQRLYDIAEEGMDKIVLEAAKEQGLVR